MRSPNNLYLCAIMRMISMKKWLLMLLFSLAVAESFAQQPKIEKRIKTWHLTEPPVLADSIAPDTSYINYPICSPIDRMSIANAYNGNLISPVQSKIYFDRYRKTDFLFADAYNPFILTPLDVTYYNTTVPYSNITYRTGGTTYREEDWINFIFTANANKKFNAGITLDYLDARGEYDNQGARRFAGSLFGSYNGRSYSAHAAVMLNTLSNFENGGLADPDALNSPVETEDMAVNLDAMSGYRYIAGFYDHKYSLGIERETKINEDSIAKVFVPVTTFGHTLQIDQACKRYVEQQPDTNFYDFTYVDSIPVNDTANVLNIRNTVSVTFEEEFNKWLKFGATVYAENEVQRFAYALPDDTLTGHEWKSNTKVGGVLSKNRGKYVRYAFGGDIYLQGYKLGEFNVHGNLLGEFRLGKDTMAITASAYVRNEEPDYFLQHYTSNHFRWDNDFRKTYKTYIGGRLQYPTRFVQADLKVGVENVTNYIYFGSDGMPVQHDGNIQVIAADMKLNFRTRHFALENNVIYQYTSSDVLPLPMVSLYHNLYYYDKYFKVLSVQFGVDMSYHTSYYAPLYMPATGQFCVQNETKVGNYPLLSAYLNFHLKQVRFFVSYYNFSSLFLSKTYYSMPGYPLNPAIFKMGVSWNFYN